MTSKWTYLTRTTSDIGHLLQPLEVIITTKLAPTLKGSAHFPYQYEEKAAHQGRESKYTCTSGGTYNNFQAILDFLCHHVQGCFLNVHTRIDAFAAYKGMIRGYTENLVIRCTLVINRILAIIPSNVTEYDVLALPARLEGITLTNSTYDSDTEFSASSKITEPLKEAILQSIH